MSNLKIFQLLFLVSFSHSLVLAQDVADLPKLNGVSLAKVPIVKEVPISLTEPVPTQHTELMYLPVQYNEAGEITAYDYVEVVVQDPPPPTVEYVTSDVLMAYITIPAMESHGIDKVQFFMGDTPGQGHNLLNTVFHLDGNPNNGEGNGNGGGNNPGNGGGLGSGAVDNPNNGNGGTNGAQSNTLVEVVNTPDMTIIVLNLGSDFVGNTNYYGEVVLQSNNGNKTTPFPFSASF